MTRDEAWAILNEYTEPGESGNKADVRWMSLTGRGVGVLAAATSEPKRSAAEKMANQTIAVR